MTPIPQRLLLLAFAATLIALAPAARGDADPALRAKMLADPAYKAYEDKKDAILRSGLKGEARSRALTALQEANWAVIQKAFRDAGIAHLLATRVRVVPEGAFGQPFTMDGDTRVYIPPFTSRVANSGNATSDGFVQAESDTFQSGAMARTTYRSYVGVTVAVPSNAVGLVASAEVDVSRVDLETNADLTGAAARGGVMVQASGLLPGDGFYDVPLIGQVGDAGTGDHWGGGTPGKKSVTTSLVPVAPGSSVRVAGGVTAWVDSNWNSRAFASATGTVRRILVSFIYAPGAAPTPTLPPAIAVPTPALIQGAANKIFAGPADVALFALPAGDGWPTELVVKNLGGKTSDSTLVRAKVVLTQGDLDVVAQNCRPRFVDFDEAVPALAPGASATIGLLTKLAPNAVAAWNGINKPALARSRPVSTPTPNPVQTIVTCRYHLTAELGKNQNLGDLHPENNKLARDIVENVPLK